MKTKEEIVANWLPRYTKRNLEDFGEYILLTNFNKYVEIFANQFNVPILGRDANMISASAEGITMINFGMGSPIRLLAMITGQKAYLNKWMKKTVQLRSFGTNIPR